MRPRPLRLAREKDGSVLARRFSSMSFSFVFWWTACSQAGNSRKARYATIVAQFSLGYQVLHLVVHIHGKSLQSLPDQIAKSSSCKHHYREFKDGERMQTKRPHVVTDFSSFRYHSTPLSRFDESRKASMPWSVTRCSKRN